MDFFKHVDLISIQEQWDVKKEVREFFSKEFSPQVLCIEMNQRECVILHLALREIWVNQNCSCVFLLQLNILESPYPKDDLCQVWLKLAQ